MFHTSGLEPILRFVPMRNPLRYENMVIEIRDFRTVRQCLHRRIADIEIVMVLLRKCIAI